MARSNFRGRLDLDLPKAKLTRESLREAATLFSYLRPYQGLLISACGALILSSLLSLCVVREFSFDWAAPLPRLYAIQIRVFAKSIRNRVLIGS